MASDQPLREQLSKVLNGGEAHATFDQAVKDFPADKMGVRPPGQPHSAWELLEHIRIAQRDILDFSRAGEHDKLKWPDDYWPKSPAPANEAEWQKSVQAVHDDVKAFQDLLHDSSNDLYKAFPWGEGQTLLREALLIIDHAAYHIGELVLLRRSLGIWPK